jgi:L-asparaginase II
VKISVFAQLVELTQVQHFCAVKMSGMPGGCKQLVTDESAKSYLQIEGHLQQCVSPLLEKVEYFNQSFINSKCVNGYLF